jgi:dUTP pyrophosphatase
LSVLSKQDIKQALNNTPPLVEGYIDLAAQLQVNGFDLSLRTVSRFLSPGRLAFDNAERQLPEMQPLEYDPDGFLTLPPGSFSITYNEIVHLPKDVMALGLSRSSLLRCGASMHTAVWDAGYEGRSESLLVVYHPQGLRLKKSARVLQLVFFRLSGETEGYKGKYQGENTLIRVNRI